MKKKFVSLGLITVLIVVLLGAYVQAVCNDILDGHCISSGVLLYNSWLSKCNYYSGCDISSDSPDLWQDLYCEEYICDFRQLYKNPRIVSQCTWASECH